MNTEILELYKKLQPRFNEVKGKWLVGDAYWHEVYKKIVYVDEFIASWFNKPVDTNIIWLPRVIDTENPERGLIGMIKGFQYLKYASTWFCCMDAVMLSHYSGDTPTEAILKALCKQEGVKV